MLFKYEKTFEWRDGTFEMSGMPLTAREIHHDVVSRMVRIQFTAALNDNEYSALLEKLK